MTEPFISAFQDNTIKFRYNERINTTIIEDLNAVGATNSLTLRRLNFDPSDLNTIFVAKIGNDTSGKGTQSEPVLTIGRALKLCDNNKKFIVILDSGTYIEEGLNFTGSVYGIYSALGQTPTIDIKEYCNYNSLTGTSGNISGNLGVADIIGNLNASFKIVPLSNGNYVLITTATDGFLVFHYIHGKTHATIQFCKDNSAFTSNAYAESPPLIAHQLQNGKVMVIAPDYRPPFPYKIFFIYDPIANTVISNFNSSNFLQSSQGCYTSQNNPISIDFCRVHGTNNQIFVVWMYKRPTQPQHYYIYGFMYDFLSETIVCSGLNVGATKRTDMNPANIVICQITSGVYSGNYAIYWFEYEVNYISSFYKCISINNSSYALTEVIPLTGLTVNSVYDYPNTTFEFNFNQDKNIIAIVLRFNDSDKKQKHSILGFSLLTKTQVFSKNITNAFLYYAAGDFCFSKDRSLLFVAVEYSSKVLKYINVAPEKYYINQSKYMIFEGLKITTSDSFIPFIPFISKSSYNISLYWCTFFGIKSTEQPSVIINGTGSLNIRNCIFHHCEKLIDVITDYINLSYNAIYLNQKDIQCQVKGSGEFIVFDHNTFYGNYQTIKLMSNSGTEIIKNSIFRNNTNGGVQSANLLSLTYCCNTDSNILINFGAGCIQANPLFKNEGILNADLIDVHLKTTTEGFSNTSPCQMAGESLSDIGCYLRKTTYLPPTYTIIEVPKPQNVDLVLDAFNFIVNEMSDGTIRTSKDGNQLTLKLKWKGLLNSHANQIYDLFNCTGDVYVYFDPVSEPLAYAIMRVKQEKISISPNFFKQGRVGTNDVEINLVGSYLDVVSINNQ
jgi:hypothetical protein